MDAAEAQVNSATIAFGLSVLRFETLLPKGLFLIWKQLHNLGQASEMTAVMFRARRDEEG
jgi:hypothetical protein